MQENVPKQSSPEKEKKEKKTSVGLTAAIAFTKVCTCRVLNYSGFFSQVQFKEFMINPFPSILALSIFFPVLGVLISKISKKSFEGFLRKLDFKLFH